MCGHVAPVGTAAPTCNKHEATAVPAEWSRGPDWRRQQHNVACANRLPPIIFWMVVTAWAAPSTAASLSISGHGESSNSHTSAPTATAVAHASLTAFCEGARAATRRLAGVLVTTSTLCTNLRRQPHHTSHGGRPVARAKKPAAEGGSQFREHTRDKLLAQGAVIRSVRASEIGSQEGLHRDMAQQTRNWQTGQRSGQRHRINCRVAVTAEASSTHEAAQGTIVPRFWLAHSCPVHVRRRGFAGMCTRLKVFRLLHGRVRS
jgi:hypothetical protein